MREEIEIIVGEALPHMDRNAPHPGYRPVDTIVAYCEHNPRGNHPKRVLAATQAMEKWTAENGGRVRSMNPTKRDNGEPGFLVIVEDLKALPRQRPVARAGVHASANRLVKR